MARAAVRAKQAQAAQAAAAARPRRDRKHASGGNPNQDLFFMRIRRKQKWVFLVLAVLFAVSFTLLGVGSGTGGGLTQLWNSLIGSNSDAVSQAQGEIKTNPTKGYRDLAAAYVANSDLPDAVTAWKQYLALKKTDAAGWTQLGGIYERQGQTYSTQLQTAQQISQIQTPSSVVAPSGKLAGIFGQNAVDAYYSQQSTNLTGPIQQQMLTAFDGALTAFQNAAKYGHGKDAKSAAWNQAFQVAAYYVGNKPAALSALKHYVQLNPTSALAKQAAGICKQLGGSCAVTSHKHHTKK